MTLKIEVGVLEDEKVTRGERQASDVRRGRARAPAVEAAAMFGLKLGSITEEARKTFSIAGGVKGVLITGVARGVKLRRRASRRARSSCRSARSRVGEPGEVSRGSNS